jgi:DNA replication protein
MNSFAGFPIRMDFTPIPRLFINQIMPEIEDAAELKILLHIFNSIYTKKGNLRFISFDELIADTAVQASLKQSGVNQRDILSQAIDRAIARGVILTLEVIKNDKKETLYFINNQNEREVIAKIQNGEINLKGIVSIPPQQKPEVQPDIFSLYEDNIGQLTPMIAEELKDALNTYPEDWIRDSIKEAVILNKRNWRYISRILERWTVEGKKNGTHKRDSEKTDPDKYISGEYGHLIQR